jgi:hypothetical protein
VSKPIIGGPSFRMARFMFSMVTGRAGGLSIPANSDASMLPGDTCARPSYAITHSRGFSRGRASRFRTSFGIVVRPFLVSIDVDILAPHNTRHSIP